MLVVGEDRWHTADVSGDTGTPLANASMTEPGMLSIDGVWT
jgi:hypothetical protein